MAGIRSSGPCKLALETPPGAVTPAHLELKQSGSMGGLRGDKHGRCVSVVNIAQKRGDLAHATKEASTVVAQ